MDEKKYWLIPSNPKNFDAIKELKKGKVWWSKKLKKMNVNDIVYIYITKPIQKIAIKAVIVEIDDENNLFVIEAVKYLDYDKSDDLSYDVLLEKAFIKGSIQNKSQIKDEKFLKYIFDNEKKSKNKRITQNLITFAEERILDRHIESEQQRVLDEERMIDNHIELEQQRVEEPKEIQKRKSSPNKRKIVDYLIDDVENLNNLKKESNKVITDRKRKFLNKKIGNSKFKYKNILLKGVPGTGKSRTIDNIITNHLNLKEEHQETNVLRINIHSASSNADLMQGIGISSNENGNIEYKEKQGLILEHIEKATFMPNQPFVLVLEEIQENSLNELIGDLIYLIENSKRAKGYKADNKEYTYDELIDEIIKQNSAIASVKLPSLISKAEKTKRMIIPHNLFIFCTSNYRDDRKVIEDNLLRRFEVIEIYPRYKDTIGDDFKNADVSKFLKDLNESIVKVCSDNGEIHPDRFMIGHSIWLEVEEKKAFFRAFLKVITEFKDVKDMHFDDFKKIVKEIKIFGVTILIENVGSYEALINILQNDCYDFLMNNE